MDKLLTIAKKYGIKGINLGGCVEGQAKGFKGAMRRSAHAHNVPFSNNIIMGEKIKVPCRWYGWICVKSSKLEKLVKENGEPNELFWHEVGHIYRKSWSQGQCDKWAWQQTRDSNRTVN